jgi:acetyltransferase-like isoleucine patch superfamily enzyme
MINPAVKDLAYLKVAYHWNRFRFNRLKRRLTGRVEFADGCDIWVPGFRYKGPGRIYFGKGAVLERQEHPSIFDTEVGSEMVLGERVLVRSKYCSNVLTCFENARIEVGDDSVLNGTVITAKNLVKLGKKVLLPWRGTILDSDMHDITNERKESIRTVEIGDYVWVGTGATILSGAKIGSHCIIAAGSVVNSDIPDHSLAGGVPAKVIKRIEDRDQAR